MQIIDERIAYSATDIVGFLACQHLTNLERAAAEGKTRRPMRRDPELDRIAKRGEQHEQRFLDDLASQGKTVVEIKASGSVTDAARRTAEAMRSGCEVVYQGTFFDGRRIGRPDFLIRVDKPSDFGPWSYEAWDTKLARHAKGSALLQLCFYSDMLHAVQGVEPDYMTLALGGSTRETVRFRTSDYGAYYRLVKKEFEKATAGDAQWPTPTEPDPVEHCEVCRWSEVCGKRLRDRDDLSLIAGIRSSQRRLLREREISTRRGVAGLSLPLSPSLDGDAKVWEKLQMQARLQVEGEDSGRVIHELLDPVLLEDGELDPEKGLQSLPEPSEGDLFFDIEGDPFALDDGVDYLFGVVEPRDLTEDGKPAFHTFWSIEGENEVTREAEKAAFEGLIDLFMDRLKKDPKLHVYHYNHYEPTAIKRLMGYHATREDEVDYLLRAGVFVDLFRVARQGIRASVESYSIKNLEPLYNFDRTIDLRHAGSSIVAFEEWLELGGDVPDDPHILDRIHDYNYDDCVSNWMLRDWLEERRTELSRHLGKEFERPEAKDGDPGDALKKELDYTQSLVDRLSAGVPEDDAKRSAEERARWLLAQTLHWHRREDKSAWWRYFHLKKKLTDEERITEPDALGGLTPEGLVDVVKESRVYRFRYPPQDHKIHEGSQPRDPMTDRTVGVVVAVDDYKGTIDIKRGLRKGEPRPTSLILLEVVPTKVLSQSLQGIAAWVNEHGICEPGPHQAARDLLLKRSPRLNTGSWEDYTQGGASAVRKVVSQLDCSYLAIQGPPGSGKSTVGAEMIVDLVGLGYRVGVTANSHKVIGGLLKKTAEVADRRGVDISIGQKPSQGSACTFAEAQPLESVAEAADALASGDVNVVGGTAWFWSADDMQSAVDYLFIDEAGQMSLTNTVAASPCAANLVLLGDPQQLDQPLKGVHPPGADRSALGHLLGPHSTIPEELGIFLDGTWRLHPDICAYTSEAFYDDKLNSHPGRDIQRVSANAGLPGSGLAFAPVYHEGNTISSEEEAEEVAKLIGLLTEGNATWTDDRGTRKAVSVEDILVVAPYNAHVSAILGKMSNANVGTVDKFQGMESPISIYSMGTSSAQEAPRGMEFLYSLNRLNVATSRARCLAVVVASPEIVRVWCKTPRQMRLANALARFVELAELREGPISL